jgi:CheY-like chemotaxis protein
MITIPRLILNEGEGARPAYALSGGRRVSSPVLGMVMAPGGRFTSRLKSPGRGASGVPVSRSARATLLASHRKNKKSHRLNRSLKVEAPIRILVVDDHPIIRQVLQQLLKRESDLEVVGEAVDGQAAIDLTRQCHPDVIIMDVNMPRLNGVEATRQILAEYPRVRVIGFSMHDEGYWQTAMRAAGAVAYVSKRTGSRQLLAAIRQS